MINYQNQRSSMLLQLDRIFALLTSALEDANKLNKRVTLSDATKIISSYADYHIRADALLANLSLLAEIKHSDANIVNNHTYAVKFDNVGLTLSLI